MRAADLFRTVRHRSVGAILPWLMAGLAATVSLQADSGFSAGKTSFAVRINGEVIDYETFAIFVLPGKKLTPRVVSAGSPQDFDHPQTWQAPQEPGVYPLVIRSRVTDETMRINVFVMVPYKSGSGESLEGYRIGRYPETALRGLKIYEPPRGLIRVGHGEMDVQVSPHFTLGQFLCKQDGDFPKFVALRERLLLKLEYLLQVANANGYSCPTFHVMSGYRTPYYNQAIGNVPYSRHLWGGAADIFIDAHPKDDRMDDLNRDGRIDRQDAEVLFRLFEGLVKRPSYEPLVGGMGLYGTTPSHGPFVHVDARGFRARW